MEEQIMQYDFLIVGAGPAGLSAAIRLKQLSPDCSICILEKASQIGAHTLSGAVIEPTALNELLPNWRELGAPLNTAVSTDQFLYLTKKRALKLPTPPDMRNSGNYIASLGQLCIWLGEQAQSLGVEIYPGFTAKEILYNEQNQVIGIKTGSMGLDKSGAKTERYQEGIKIQAKQTLIAEGCRGSLTRELEQEFTLRNSKNQQTYAIGIKELWEISPEKHELGKVVHTIGWPLDQKTYGGSFIYHFENNLLSIGLVVGLDYSNPYLDPYQEMQRFKTHPAIKTLLEGGERRAYGARALNEGGLQSIPNLSFPGGVLIGDCAGFLNVPKIKGSHTAMKSAMLAAEVAIQALESDATIQIDYTPELKKSWVWQELYKVRNVRPGFHFGLFPGLAYAAVDQYIFRGKAPWTFKHYADYKQLKLAKHAKPIEYPKPDGVITFDKLSSVYLTNTNHEENQPCHLQLQDPKIAIDYNYKLYASPEQYYCPAAVYEIVQKQDQPTLQINAQNCIHCKTCDIKDPKQNIIWTPPEGGGGPNYSGM